MKFRLVIFAACLGAATPSVAFAENCTLKLREPRSVATIQRTVIEARIVQVFVNENWEMMTYPEKFSLARAAYRCASGADQAVVKDAASGHPLGAYRWSSSKRKMTLWVNPQLPRLE